MDVPPLINTHWLADNLENVAVVDGTWVLPAEEASLASGYIPGGRVFDLDEVASPHASLKHMLPTAESFAKAVGGMGIGADDHVVCYDRHGIFSSPRLWWTFKIFGHAKVSVLDGGLPAWLTAGHAVTERARDDFKEVDYVPRHALAKVIDKAGVLAALGTNVQIIDARPPGRFAGTSPEPRAYLRGGHMPGALNVPFGTLRRADGHLKETDELLDAVAAIDPERPIITTCGSGITAAGLAFVMEILGAQDVSVYDGSWAEWGADPDVPIVTG